MRPELKVDHWEWVSSSSRATRELGEWLGREAYPGLVIALIGDLGAGKTCLIQGLARGLGVPAGTPVTSPTFSLINPYQGRLPLYHLDIYRLGSSDELDALGFRELFGGQAVTVVEWADRFLEVFPREFLRIKIAHRSSRTRRFQFDVVGGGPEAELLSRLKSQFARHESKTQPISAEERGVCDE